MDSIGATYTTLPSGNYLKHLKILKIAQAVFPEPNIT